LEDLLVLKNTGHDRNVEAYLRRLWIDCFRRVVFESENRADLILGSVEAINRARQFLGRSCIRSVEGRKMSSADKGGVIDGPPKGFTESTIWTPSGSPGGRMLKSSMSAESKIQRSGHVFGEKQSQW
jgi:hypothetical protein